MTNLPQGMNMSLNLRSIFILGIIERLGKFLDVSEAQIEQALHMELQKIESNGPVGGHEEDYHQWCRDKSDVQNLYDRDLWPALRYSFVVLLHITFETQLRVFCADLQSERSLP